MDELTSSLSVSGTIAAAAVGFSLVKRWIRRRRQARIRWEARKMGLHRACHPQDSPNDIRRERFLLLGGERKSVGDGVENLLQSSVQGRQLYLFDCEETISREANAWQAAGFFSFA